jgi:hypothetical protein
MLLRSGASSRVMRLQGISIGNGFIDPYSNLDYPNFLFNLGFVSERQKHEGELIVQRIKKLIKSELWEKAFQVRFEKAIMVYLTVT